MCDDLRLEIVPRSLENINERFDSFDLQSEVEADEAELQRCEVEAVLEKLSPDFPVVKTVTAYNDDWECWQTELKIELTILHDPDFLEGLLLELRGAVIVLAADPKPTAKPVPATWGTPAKSGTLRP